MAETKTLAELRTITRELADIERQTARFPDAEVDRRVNEGIKRLRALLLRCNGASFLSDEASAITTTAGTAKYDLPSDFQQLLAAVLSDGTSWHQLETWEPSELARMLEWSDGNGGGSIYHIRYQLTPEQIELQPAPQSAYTLTLRYVPTAPVLTADEETIDGLGDWHMYICTHAAIACKAKDEEDVSVLAAQLAGLEKEIQAAAPSRDRTRPARVVDAERDGIHTFGGYRDDWNL